MEEGGKTQMQDQKPFADEELKKRSREDFVSNECGTDEYRETEPAKGLGFISNALELLSEDYEDNRDRYVKLLDLTLEWLQAAKKGEPGDETKTLPYYWYAGAEELRPVLNEVHDIFWEHGKHPYYGTDLATFLEDVEEDEDG